MDRLTKLSSLYGVVLLPCLLNFATCKIYRPKGVSILQATFYEEGKPFRCLDGSYTIDFTKINDEYCDCSDGSDEPGTSACPNGSFHCTNVGHVFQDIPSSRVNDGVCDCCDGADEYKSTIKCLNNCNEMGAAAREEQEKKRKAMEEGHKVYMEYVDTGSKAHTELQNQKESLSMELARLEEYKKELEALKDEAESPEKEAKSKHEDWWKEEKEKRNKEKEAQEATEAFNTLDTDEDGQITIAEMQTHSEFDIDADQTVSEEEAKEYLEDHDIIDSEFFTSNVWPNIKSVFTKKEIKEEPEEPSEEEEEAKTDEYDDEEEEYPSEEDDDDDDEDYEEKEEEDVEKKPLDDTMPDYDEETKALIQTADSARANFKSADDNFKEVERKVNDIKKVLDLDLGLNFEFHSLNGKCFEFPDREYVYKLCPFDRAAQKGKSGGVETSLGQWSKWDGPEDDKYSVMLFENGQSCWNGPNRSVRVHLECGFPNELLSAEEPNRCVYSFRFKTPAICSTVPPPHEHYDHERHVEL